VTASASLTIGMKDDLQARERFAVQIAAEYFMEAGRGKRDDGAREQAERNAGARQQDPMAIPTRRVQVVARAAFVRTFSDDC
jgi:hypothetical protein